MSGNEPNWKDDEQELPSFDEQGGPDLYGDTPSGPDGPLWEPTGEESSFEAPVSPDGPEEGRDGLSPTDEPVEVTEPQASADAAGEPEGELPSIGNRPAEGARVASASEVLSEDFLGTEGASDFLGLDMEMDDGPAEAFGSPADAFAAPTPPQLQPQAFAGTATEVPPVNPMAAPDAGFGDGYEEGAEFVDEAGEFGEGEFGDEEFEGEFEEEPVQRKGSGLMLVAGAFGLGLVVVAAVVLGPKYMNRGGEGPVELAGGGPTPGPVAPVQPADPATDPSTDPVAGDPTPADPTPNGGEPVEPLSIEDFVTSQGGPTTDPGTDPTVDPAADPSADPALDPATDPLAGDPTPFDPTQVPGVDNVPVGDFQNGMTLEELIAMSADPDGFLGTNPGLVDLVWRGEEVPLEAMGVPSRILTPKVGRVRVLMASTDVFEGRLYAMGNNRIELDLSLGRIALDGAVVDRIDRLPDGDQSSQVVEASDLPPGRRVRAIVPGGVIYGRVRSIKGEEVTLVTDSGSRITLQAPQLEPVNERKSVVLKL